MRFLQQELRQQPTVALSHWLRNDALFKMVTGDTQTEFVVDDASELTDISVRCFGKTLSALDFLTLLQALPNPHVLACQLSQPHPELEPALVFYLQQPLTQAELAKVQDAVLPLQLEMVYLNQSVKIDQPGLLVMDMDSTAIAIECIDEIAMLAGVGKQVAAVTARAMNGELDFAESLRERVAALQGAPVSILQQVLDSLPLMPGLTTLVSVLQHQGWKVAIASGGFTFFTDALKQRLGLCATFANQLEIHQGCLTGQVTGDIVDAKRKALVVEELTALYQIDPAQTVAIGDGANDVPMLNTAALGVAFHAKPKVQALAKACIHRGSLLQLLYLFDLKNKRA